MIIIFQIEEERKSLIPELVDSGNIIPIPSASTKVISTSSPRMEYY